MQEDLPEIFDDYTRKKIELYDDTVAAQIDAVFALRLNSSLSESQVTALIDLCKEHLHEEILYNLADTLFHHHQIPRSIDGIKILAETAKNRKVALYARHLLQEIRKLLPAKSNTHEQ